MSFRITWYKNNFSISVITIEAKSEDDADKFALKCAEGIGAETLTLRQLSSNNG